MRPERQSVRTLAWRLFLINGALFTVGTLLLAFLPVTVSTTVVWAEIPVLFGGLALILVANAILVSTSLKRLQAEHTASSALALAAQEGERQRIARELHDEIGQSLTVALLALRRVVDRVPEDLRGEAELAQDSVRESVEEVREVARRLRPGVLSDLGLRSALKELVDEFQRKSGVKVVRILPNPIPPLGGEVELVIYRVAQEALTNIARHARASSAKLALEVADRETTLLVADDGVGGVHEEGVGIRGMRERAALVGAELLIGPARARGTEVRLVVPR